MKGCELCPTNEDVWLEAARLQVGGRLNAAWCGLPMQLVGRADVPTVRQDE